MIPGQNMTTCFESKYTADSFFDNVQVCHGWGMSHENQWSYEHPASCMLPGHENERRFQLTVVTWNQCKLEFKTEKNMLERLKKLGWEFIAKANNPNSGINLYLFYRFNPKLTYKSQNKGPTNWFMSGLRPTAMPFYGCCGARLIELAGYPATGSQQQQYLKELLKIEKGCFFVMFNPYGYTRIHFDTYVKLPFKEAQHVQIDSNTSLTVFVKNKQELNK